MVTRSLVVQPGPQSWRNTPTPSRPLAPKAETVSRGFAVPQVFGAVAGTAVSLITWIGTELADSPAILTSAVRTAPQENELTNWTQLATVSAPCMVAGSCDVNADVISLSPADPVSTHTWSMF